MGAAKISREEAIRLSRIFDAADPGVGDWLPEELGPVMRFQLEAPLVDDLCGNSTEVRARVERLAAAAKPPIRTFSDLLFHPAPPLELLVMVKDFAKAVRSEGDGRLPAEVATVLYYAAIAAALAHGHKKISELDDSTLRAGVNWALAWPWLDDKIRELFIAAWPTNI